MNWRVFPQVRETPHTRFSRWRRVTGYQDHNERNDHEFREGLEGSRRTPSLTADAVVDSWREVMGVETIGLGISGQDLIKILPGFLAVLAAALRLLPNLVT